MTDTTLAHQAAALTTIQEHIDRFWRMLETEHVRLLVDMRRDTTSVPYWDSSSFPDEVAKALVADHARLTAANRALTEQIEKATDPEYLATAMEKVGVCDVARAIEAENDRDRYIEGKVLAEAQRDAAEAKLAKVEAERDALKHDIARHIQIASDEATLADGLVASKARLSAELAEARKLLRPLARIAEAEDFAGTKDGESILVNVNLCRAARSFLSSKEASHGR